MVSNVDGAAAELNQIQPSCTRCFTSVSSLVGPPLANSMRGPRGGF
jgi:hypothetical protein